MGEYQKKLLKFKKTNGIKIFAQLHKYNIQKCYMKFTYPLNTEKLKQWIDYQRDSKIEVFIRIFCKYITHVSFEMWYTALFNLYMDINADIDINKYTRIIIIINGKIDDSPMWVALLLYDLLNNLVTDVTSPDNLAEYIQYLLSNNPHENILCLYVYDVLYDTTQLNLDLVLKNVKLQNPKLQKTETLLLTFSVFSFLM